MKVAGLYLMMCCMFAPGTWAEVKPAKRLAEETVVRGAELGQGTRVRLFILSGQSNMAALRHRDSFIPVIEKAFPDDTLIFVKHARSGQPIRRWHKEWQPVGDWKPRNKREVPGRNDLYVALMDMVNEATDGITLDSVAFVWMQGEADAKHGQSMNYRASLQGVIQQIRDDTGHPDAVAVVGRLSDHLNGDAHWDRVRAVQVDVCEADPLAAWVDTDDLNGTHNGLHYAGDGYQKLGERFAEETIKLLQRGSQMLSGAGW
jgi:hypothetical protein